MSSHSAEQYCIDGVDDTYVIQSIRRAYLFATSLIYVVNTTLFIRSTITSSSGPAHHLINPHFQKEKHANPT